MKPYEATVAAKNLIEDATSFAVLAITVDGPQVAFLIDEGNDVEAFAISEMLGSMAEVTRATTSSGLLAALGGPIGTGLPDGE